MNRRINGQQKSRLVELMENNVKFLYGRTRERHERVSRERRWNEIALELNGMAMGCSKSGLEWKHCFTNMRLTLQEKLRAKQADIQSTGSGSLSDDLELTEIEKKILRVWSLENINGRSHEQPEDPNKLVNQSSSVSGNSFSYSDSFLPVSINEEGPIQIEVSMQEDPLGLESEDDPCQPPTLSPPHDTKRRRLSSTTSTDSLDRNEDNEEEHRQQKPSKLKTELVDAFCSYLSVQLKNMSTPVFLDVQIDVQMVVLQAQRQGMDFIPSSDEEENKSSKVSANDREINEEKKPHGSDKMVDTSNKSNVQDEIEVDYSYCQIKSEPIEDNVKERSDGIKAHHPKDTLANFQKTTTSFSVDRTNPTVITSRSASQKRTSVIASAQLEENTRRLHTTVQKLSRNQLNFSNTTYVSNSICKKQPHHPKSEIGRKNPGPSKTNLHFKYTSENGVLIEVVAAIATLSIAVSTLSAALNELHLYFNGMTTSYKV